MTYYSDIEPFAIEWLGNLMDAGLIPQGRIDDRDIRDISPADLAGVRRAHFFAGIGGWELALQLAGWPDAEVWTGSCPCQPFSAAGKGKGEADERHLWPEFLRLIRECKPRHIFGEQVASAEVVGSRIEADFVAAVQASDHERANKLAERIEKQHSGEELDELPERWIDRVQADLEEIGYAFEYIVLGAHSIGAPHIRQRLFWGARFVPSVALGVFQGRAESIGRGIAGGCCDDSRVADAEMHDRARECRAGDGRCELQDRGHSTDSGLGHAAGKNPRGGQQRFRSGGRASDGASANHQWSEDSGVGDTDLRELPIDQIQPTRQELPSAAGAGWADFDLLPCLDGKSRRVESGSFPLAYGLPRNVDDQLARLCELAGMAGDVRELRAGLKRAKRNRVGQLKGYGNAIIPQLAAEFIQAFMETE